MKITCAKMIRNSPEKYILFEKNVVINRYADSLVVFANKGKYFLDTSEMELTGNPKAINEDNEFFADTIYYNSSSGEIRLLENAKIDSENSTITSENIFYYPKKQLVNINDNAKVVSGNRTIRADRIEYYLGEKSKAFLYGNCILKEYGNDESLLQGQVYRYAESEKVKYYKYEEILEFQEDVYFYQVFKDRRTEDNFIIEQRIFKREVNCNSMQYYLRSNRMRMEENVVIKEPYRLALANMVEYRDQKNSAQLTGNAKIYDFRQKNEIVKLLEENPKEKISMIKRKVAGSNIEILIGEEENIKVNGDASFEVEGLTGSGDYVEYNSGAIDTAIVKGNAQIKNDFIDAKGETISFTEMVGSEVLQRIIIEKNANVLYETYTAYANKIIYYDKKTTPVAVLMGNAHIYDDEKDIRSDKIYIYDFGNDRNKMVMVGNPKLRISNRVITGETIEYNISGSSENGWVIGNVEIFEEKANTFQSVKADGAEFKQVNFSQIVSLFGNVLLADEQNEIKADYGEYRFNENVGNKSHLRLSGNIFINNEGTKIYGDILDYFSYTRGKIQDEIFNLIGNVKVSGEEFNANSLMLEYNRKVDNLGNIYDDEIVLKGDIELFEGENKGYADYAEYLTEKVNGEIKEKIILKDEPSLVLEDGTTLTGDKIEYNRSDDVLVSKKNSSLTVKSEEDEQEYTITCDDIVYYRKRGKIYFVNDIKILGDGNLAYGDKAEYDEKTQKLIITESAVLETETNISKAGKIIYDIQKNEIELINNYESILKANTSSDDEE